LLKDQLPIPTNRDVISQCLNAEGRFVIWADAGNRWEIKDDGRFYLITVCKNPVSGGGIFADWISDIFRTADQREIHIQNGIVLNYASL
jgi:hypothetical protein